MAKKTEKKSKPESKTPELTKAKKALDAYLYIIAHFRGVSKFLCLNLQICILYYI